MNPLQCVRLKAQTEYFTVHILEFKWTKQDVKEQINVNIKAA